MKKEENLPKNRDVKIYKYIKLYGIYILEWKLHMLTDV